MTGRSHKGNMRCIQENREKEEKRSRETRGKKENPKRNAIKKESKGKETYETEHVQPIGKEPMKQRKRTYQLDRKHKANE